MHGSSSRSGGGGVPGIEVGESPWGGPGSLFGVSAPGGGVLDRLGALRAATSTRADANLAVLAAIESAREVYRPALASEELLGRLRPGLVDDGEDLRVVLEALQGWGCVVGAVDRRHRHVQRLRDFYRAQLEWRITPTGRAVLTSARLVVEAVEATGGLRARVLGEVRRRLAQLADAVGAGDEEGTFLALRGLDADLADVTRSAQDFAATLAVFTATADGRDDDGFDLAKRVLVEHLAGFSDDLYLLRGELAARADALDGIGGGRIGELAAAGDDAAAEAFAGERGRAELVAWWRARWAAMHAWLAGDGDRPSGVAELAQALTDATTTIVAHVRRLSEVDQLRVSRAGDLVTLAGWFAASDEGGAHELFDAAFGLGHAARVQGMTPEVVTRRAPSWFDGPTVEVAVSVRARGASTGTGRTAKVVDFAGDRAELGAAAARATARRAAAAASLLDGLDGELSSEAFELLLGGIGDALARRASDGVAAATVEGVRIEVRADPAGTLIRGPAGVFRAPGVAVAVSRVACGHLEQPGKDVGPGWGGDAVAPAVGESA